MYEYYHNPGYYKNISIEELEKSIALSRHQWAYTDMKIYGLPYKVMYDYIDEWELKEDETPLNLYYPFEDVPKPGYWDFETDGHYSSDEWLTICMKKTGRIIDGKEEVEFFHVPPQIQALIDEKGKPFRLWDTETAAGLQGWLYYFMVYIMPYADDIPTFSQFDMFGDTKHTEQELEERRAYYTDLIRKCKEQPELYKHGVQKRAEPLDILRAERDMIVNYDQERTDTNTRAYRIADMIKRIETYNACKKPEKAL